MSRFARSVNVRFTIVCAAVLFAVVPAKSAAIYQVTVNTSAVSGVAGNLDFQFNPGGPSSQSAFAQITGFTSVGGSLSGVPSVIGAVTGVLPATVTISNTSALNDYFHAFTFGTSFQFTLTLDGPAITAPNGTATAGSAFGLALYDNAGIIPLLTTDPNGFAGIADVHLNGSVTTTTFPSNPNGGAPVVTFTPVGVPEPSTLLSMSGALLALAIVAARRKAIG